MISSETEARLAKFVCFAASLGLTLFGITLTYLGFVMPGLMWCSNFADTEMISLVICVVVGGAGLVLCSFGLIVLVQAIKLEF